MHVIVHYPLPPSSHLSEIFGTNNLIMCHTCKGLNNQPKDSDELCATDGESAELGAILSQIRLAQSSLHFYATLYIYYLYIYIFVLSLHLYTYNLSIFICTFYMLFLCSLRYIPFTFILYPHLYVLYILCTPIHLCLSTFDVEGYIYPSTFVCASTFNTAPTLYALYIYMVP